MKRKEDEARAAGLRRPRLELVAQRVHVTVAAHPGIHAHNVTKTHRGKRSTHNVTNIEWEKRAGYLNACQVPPMP